MLQCEVCETKAARSPPSGPNPGMPTLVPGTEHWTIVHSGYDLNTCTRRHTPGKKISLQVRGIDILIGVGSDVDLHPPGLDVPFTFITISTSEAQVLSSQ